MIVFPAGMDDGDWALTESKGWLEVEVRLTGGTRTITFYDPVRLAQEVHDAMERGGYFAEQDGQAAANGGVGGVRPRPAVRRPAGLPAQLPHEQAEQHRCHHRADHAEAAEHRIRVGQPTDRVGGDARPNTLVMITVRTRSPGGGPGRTRLLRSPRMINS